MNNIINLSLALVLVFVTFNPGSVSSIRIDIEPNSKKITCVADKLVPLAMTITSIQLYCPNGSVIVRLDQSSKVTGTNDPHLFIIKTDGKIEKNVEKSHLTVTMSDILIKQSGWYTCTVYYKNMEGFDYNQSARDLLNITSQDIPPSLDAWSYKLWKLGRGLAEMHKVSSRVKKLEDWAKKQKTRLTSMEQRANYMSAFSAGYDDDSDILEKNRVVVFRIVHMKVGNGYNETTGIFTAPVEGYYVFHLVIFYEDTEKDDLGVNIMANGKAVAQAYIDDPKDMIQASVSTIVKLEAGHEVKPVVSHFLGETNTLNLGITRSGFTGYLIKAL